MLFDDSCETILRNYLRAGGKLIIEGRDAFLSSLGLSPWFNDLGPYWWCDFPYNWLHLDAVYRNTFTVLDSMNREFVGAKSLLPEYPDLEIDTARVNRSVDPGWLQLHGKLPGVGYIIPRDFTEYFYTFRSAYPGTSSLEGMPVAIRYLGTDHQVILFCFPLYFIQEEQATQLLHQALADLGIDPTEVEDEEEHGNMPASFSLKQNYPNPFNPGTIIEYELPKASMVEITIYNILGQKVRTLVKELQKAGMHCVQWDGMDEKGKQISSGIYFYQIKTPELSQTKKMVLLR